MKCLLRCLLGLVGIQFLVFSTRWYSVFLTVILHSLYYYEKNTRFPRLTIAYSFSNARLLFLNPSIVVSPLFFNFELPVTHLMVMFSIMQPNPAPDNPLIYTEQQRQRRQNSSNI